jgi:aryl-alcohol dehydrogenase-like predicted oxidoreductase
MKYRKLGKTDVAVSEVSLGCWTLGGQNWRDGTPIGWADVNEDEAAAAVRYGLDRGVNHFDNADVYGNGRAERMLARILGDKVNDVIIATKIGHHPGTADHAYDPLHIRHQCEQSLKNLRREVIDIYYFHHGDFGQDDALLDDALAVMNKLRDEGKFRVLGLSAYSHDDFTRLIPRINPDVLQAKNHILDHKFVADGTPTRKLMEERGLSLVAFSPLGQGLLLDKFDPANPPTFAEGDNRRNKDAFAAESLADLKPKLEQIKERFGDSTADLARVALQFILSFDVVGCVIPGFRNESQVVSNLGGADQPLSDEDIAFIRETFGL